MTSYSPCPEQARCERGFTLVELTVVLLIVGLLVGGLVLPLSVQRDIQNLSATRRQLVEIREALLGFAAAHGRLPCPARVRRPASKMSMWRPASAGMPGLSCPPSPWASRRSMRRAMRWTLGATGFAMPLPNPSLAVARWYSLMLVVSSSYGVGRAPTPDLRVCSTSVGIGGDTCAAGAELASGAVAVVWSTGGNGVSPGADEQANATSQADVRTFVSHAPSPADAPQGEFDDILVWLSPHVLYNRMISAGRLP